uniref:Col_cuticle_N domain-containing protein n=1 Tax=Rodentolepis nana TaxID=102285 RepID=A0A0R3T120_RODNA
LGSQGGSADNGLDKLGGDGKVGDYQGPGGKSGRLQSGIYQDHDTGNFKPSSDPISPPSQPAYSSNQMKIISVLVSIAGIFYFASPKSPEPNNRIVEGESLVAIPPKHEVLAISPSGRGWSDDYRTLGENYPESVFCVNQKLSNDSGTKKRMGREGNYDISAPFSTTMISTTNTSSNYPSNIITGPRFIGSYQNIPASPKMAPACKANLNKPLMVSTIRPAEHINLELTNRKPTAILAPDGRLIPIENTEFYGFSETYQTLDPSTFSKSTKKTKESSRPSESTNVTFNLEMIPMSQSSDNRENCGFSRLLKNDIISDKGEDNEREEQNKSIDDGRHELLVYGKSGNHSSFV